MERRTFNFESGWNNFQKASGANGAFIGDSYIAKVNDSIDTLTKSLNDFTKGKATDINYLKGDVAEYWHGGTFNVRATIKGSELNAEVLKVNGYGSVDVAVSDGGNFSLKYYKDASSSAQAQATNHYQNYMDLMSKYRKAGKEEISFNEFLQQRGLSEETVSKFDSMYKGQGRVIPKDQLEDAKEALERRIQRASSSESQNQQDLVPGLKETKDKLTETVHSKDGTISSERLSDAEAKEIAREGKDGNFDAREHGVTTEELMGIEDIAQKAVEAGLTAAVISCVLKMAPEIYKAIDMLIKDGEISKDQFEKIGFAALSGSAEGFIRGSISAGLTAACKSGLLGETLKSVDPTMIGALTVIAMNTIANSYKLATKRISKGEFAHEVSKDIFVTSCALMLGGVAQGLTPELPVLGYLLGSFIGSLGGSILYDTGYSAFMSLCCDTGFTCFGLVEQDYKIPKEILDRIGIKIFDFKNYEPKKYEYKKFEVSKFSFSQYEYETIKIDFLKRDVIGIGKIAYV